MGFLESINSLLGLCNEGSCPFRITVLGYQGVYIEGVICVCNVESDEIIISVRGGKVSVKGSGLSLGSYTEKDLMIKGSVKEIKWL